MRVSLNSWKEPVISKSPEASFRICSRCIMDETDPAISFDESGVCNHCVTFDEKFSQSFTHKGNPKNTVKDLVAEIKTMSNGKKYDGILGLSGGVDSTYAAYIAKKQGLNPLCVHVDCGWNSELAVKNIENTVTKLGLDLYTYVVNWDEMKELQLAFFKASLANCDIPNDHAITAALYKVAKEQKIDVIISGSNLATESILPFDWGYDAKDSIHLKSVLKKYGRIKSLEDYPVRSVFDFYFKDSYFPAIKSFRILDSVMYTKKEAKDAITSELEWVDYGGKHYESVFTRFFQGYYLPKKFGFDKRKAHLSSLILSGQITRAEALSQLKAEDYSSELKHQDLEFVSKKLGISVEEFETIIDQKPKSFSDYPSFYPIMQFLRKLKALIKKN